MTPGARPRVTISLVTWNGMRWLDACLQSVLAQTLTDWELRIIDNASTDGSAQRLGEWAHNDGRICLERLSVNTGYAVAHNRSIWAARGEIVLLLNQDVVLDDEFLRAAVTAFDADTSIGSVQARIRRLGQDLRRLQTLDTTGLVMYRSRLVASRDQLHGDSRGGVRAPGPVWGVDGPAPAYRRAALLSARLPRRGGGYEVLDEDFFLQKEDVDLAWRLHRLGWLAWFEPAALAWHARTGGTSRRDSCLDALRANLQNPLDIRVLAWRNQRLMQLKNDVLSELLRDLPWIVAREVSQWLFVLVADQRRLAAIPQLLRHTSMALRKRRALHAAIRRRPGAT